MRGGRAARLAVAVVVAALVAACTTTDPDQEPSPSASGSASPAAPASASSAGERIAIIVAPDTLVPPAEAAALATAAAELAADPPDGVAGVTVVTAASEDFARDLAEFAVDDGHDVVCVVGTGAAPLVLELARARRDGRFCTTDPQVTGGPVNLVAVGVDPGALVEAGAVAIGTAPAPVGLLLVEQLGDLEALTTAFTGRVAAPRPAPPTPTPSPTPTVAPAAGPPFVTRTAGTGAPAQLAAAEELATARPSRALVLATVGGHPAAVAAGRTGAQLVVVSDWVVDAEGELPSGLLVALTVDWATLLRDAVEAALTTDAPQVQLRGVGGALLGALPGQAPGAAAAADRTNDHLARSVAATSDD